MEVSMIFGDYEGYSVHGYMCAIFSRMDANEVEGCVCSKTTS